MLDIVLTRCGSWCTSNARYALLLPKRTRWVAYGWSWLCGLWRIFVWLQASSTSSTSCMGHCHRIPYKSSGILQGTCGKCHITSEGTCLGSSTILRQWQCIMRFPWHSLPLSSSAVFWQQTWLDLKWWAHGPIHFDFLVIIRAYNNGFIHMQLGGPQC